MIFKVEAKKALYINEWQLTVTNDLSHDIMVDLGHTELMTKTILIKEVVDVPEVFKQE